MRSCYRRDKLHKGAQKISSQLNGRSKGDSSTHIMIGAKVDVVADRCYNVRSVVVLVCAWRHLWTAANIDIKSQAGSPFD